MATDRSFAEIVSLACHDLRTPLATVHGFARTLERIEAEDERASRYIGLIVAGSGQIADLLERLALVARIERGAYEPALQEEDSLDLAEKAAGLVDAGEVSVSGAGMTVRVDPDPTERSLAGFLTCALRHGDSDRVECAVHGAAVTIRPVTEGSGPILLGDDLRDFGAVAARIHVEALGGRVGVEGDRLRVELATT